ncbi:MAG TPA: hypothetical protein VIF12_02100 [Micavibrio sp.]
MSKDTPDTQADNPAATSYRIAKLTHQDAEKMGHIAWIESGNPREALTAMHQAIQTEPINCAIWANAGELIPQEARNLIRAWNDMPLTASRAEKKPVIVNTRHRGEFDNAESQARHIFRTIFESAIQDVEEEYVSDAIMQAFNKSALDAVDRHVMNQISDIAAILNPAEMPTLTRHRLNKSSPNLSNPHTDGGRKNSYQLIQSLESVSTYLIDNRDAIPAPEQNAPGKAIFSKKPGTVFWEVPRNSLTLLTNNGHPHQAILHDFPWLPPDRDVTGRTVVIYNLSAPVPR